MYTYGPIPSRRLGRSLGVNLTPPKTCSYSCVYCQLGQTNHLQIKRERFYPPEDILEEILKSYSETTHDYITFVGDGEPTLYQNLGWLIRRLKRIIKTPIAVITNGSLLYRKDVRQDLELADVIIPSLDAGNERTLNLINRHHSGIDFHMLVNGLTQFRKIYDGQLWLEVMLVRGLNDSEEELEKIKKIIDKISPDRIYLLTPIRPPAEKWVSAPDHKSIILATEILGQSVPIIEYEPNEIDIQSYRSARQAILSIGTCHPLRNEQAEEIATHFDDRNVIKQLIAEGLFTALDFNGKEYLMPKFDKINSKHKIKEK